MQTKTKKHERDQTEAMDNETEMSKYLNKILKTSQERHRHSKDGQWGVHITWYRHTRRASFQTLPHTQVKRTQYIPKYR